MMYNRRRYVGGGMELAPATNGNNGTLKLERSPGGTWTSCGRNALMLLLVDLQVEGLKRILLPGFICESVIQVVKEIGLAVSFYDVSSDFEAAVECRSGDGLLIVHYFGWRNPMISTAEWVIEDYSHALLSNFDPKPEHFTFFSARKFSAINAGGWCSANVQSDLTTDDSLDDVLNSLERGQKMKREYLQREGEDGDEEIENGYLALFEALESFFDSDCKPRAIPDYVRNAIDIEDWSMIRTMRRKNWIAIHRCLNARVPVLFESLPSEVCPMGYILRLDSKHRDRVRNELKKHNVYTGVHWPLPEQVSAVQCPGANTLTGEILTLPVDHRYRECDMEWVAEQVLSLC